MKKIVLLVIVAIFFVSSLASAKNIPRAVSKDIEIYAVLKYPSDREMQQYTIKNQRESWMAIYHLKRVPEIKKCILDEIKNNAQDKWNNDYVMQMHEIQEQCIAYREIKHFKSIQKIPKAIVNLKIKKMAENKWPDDYVMQLEGIKDLCRKDYPGKSYPSATQLLGR